MLLLRSSTRLVNRSLPTLASCTDNAIVIGLRRNASILSSLSPPRLHNFPLVSQLVNNEDLFVHQRNCHNLKAETKQKELSLRNEIVQRIKACGPITVAEYMKMVLTNPISVSQTCLQFFTHYDTRNAD